MEQAELGEIFSYKKVEERLVNQPIDSDEDKELDDLIDLMYSDKYLELDGLYFHDTDKYVKENSITIYWWKADRIIKDVKRLKKGRTFGM